MDLFQLSFVLRAIAVATADCAAELIKKTSHLMTWLPLTKKQ
jgi:hypothetical protein